MHMCGHMMINFIGLRHKYDLFPFFARPSTGADAHIHKRLTPMNSCSHTLPLWAPPKNWVGLTNLEIVEVTTGISLSMGTSPTTERIAPLNPRINPEKYKHPCQVGDLNLGGQVPPQGTQLAELRWVLMIIFWHGYLFSFFEFFSMNEPSFAHSFFPILGLSHVHFSSFQYFCIVHVSFCKNFRERSHSWNFGTFIWWIWKKHVFM
jgi:hypothetical protein